MQEKRVRLRSGQSLERRDFATRRLENWRGEMANDIRSVEARILSSINSKLLKGELSPAQAEIEAARDGFIFGKPTDPAFDPCSCSDWTPLQAIAWIATRDANCVREVSFEARKRTVAWRKTVALRESANLIVLDKPTISLLNEISPSDEQATADLWGCLRGGEIQASGLNAPGAPRVEISALEWVDFRLFGDDVVYLGDRFLMTSHSYFKVRIDRGAIVSIWPEPKVGDEESRTRAEPTPAKSKGGRQPSHNWGALKTKCLDLFEYHGDFDADDPHWNCQARLEEALMQFYLAEFGRDLPIATIRPPLSGWRDEWLSLKLKA